MMKNSGTTQQGISHSSVTSDLLRLLSTLLSNRDRVYVQVEFSVLIFFI